MLTRRLLLVIDEVAHALRRINDGCDDATIKSQLKEARVWLDRAEGRRTDRLMLEAAIAQIRHADGCPAFGYADTRLAECQCGLRAVVERLEKAGWPVPQHRQANLTTL